MTHPDYTPCDNIEEIYARLDTTVSADEWPMFEQMVEMLLEAEPQTDKDVTRAIIAIRQRFKRIPKKSQLLHVYLGLVSQGKVAPHAPMQDLLVKKSGKSQSGVLVITVRA